MGRKSGILLPISSLSSDYGIGSFSKEAYEFVDFLEKAGQSYWQILPLGQTGYGDSPYQSFSTFAGNPYFIDLDALIEEGLARELVSKIQQMRKSKDFDMMDRIHIYVGADEAVQAAIGAFGDWIKAETLADSIEAKDGLEQFDLNGHKTGIDVERI